MRNLSNPLPELFASSRDFIIHFHFTSSTTQGRRDRGCAANPKRFSCLTSQQHAIYFVSKQHWITFSVDCYLPPNITQTFCWFTCDSRLTIIGVSSGNWQDSPCLKQIRRASGRKGLIYMQEVPNSVKPWDSISSLNEMSRIRRLLWRLSSGGLHGRHELEVAARDRPWNAGNMLVERKLTFRFTFAFSKVDNRNLFLTFKFSIFS